MPFKMSISLPLEDVKIIHKWSDTPKLFDRLLTQMFVLWLTSCVDSQHGTNNSTTSALDDTALYFSGLFARINIFLNTAKLCYL